MSSANREKLLHDASAAKMRAMRLRTLGDAEDQRRAIVLLHDAAQKELAAAAALPGNSPREETRARLEACGLLLEAQDPLGAAKVWAFLPRWAFTQEAAEMLSRVRSRYETQVAAFAEAWHSLGDTSGAAPSIDSALLDRLRAACADYAGVAELWSALAMRTTGHEADAARQRATELNPDLAHDEHAYAAWTQIERTLVRMLKIELHAERRGAPLELDLVSRIVAAFGDLLSCFVERTFGGTVALIPSAAVRGSFILDVAAYGLPREALEEMDRALTTAPDHVDANRFVGLLGLLQHHGVRLVISVDDGDVTEGLVIDAQRRVALLEGAAAAALRTLDSRDVPQADDLDRVFDIVRRIAAREQVDADSLGITARQVSYYLRAARILGLVADDSDELTAGGRLIARLEPDDRLRATVVHFESSTCGDAWIRWSSGKTLRDVDPNTAFEFLHATVPGLAEETAERRAQTLLAWYGDLIKHHYAQ